MDRLYAERRRIELEADWEMTVRALGAERAVALERNVDDPTDLPYDFPFSRSLLGEIDDWLYPKDGHHE